MQSISEFNQFDFKPDIDRTSAMGRAVRHRFIESVETVIEHAKRLGVSSENFPAWANNIETCKRVPPTVWGRYHDLVQAAMRDDLEAVARFSNDIFTFEASRASTEVSQVVTISSDSLGVDAERYTRLVDSDPKRPIGLVPVSSDEMARVRSLLDEARVLLSETSPVLLDEIDLLGHQIVLAKSAGTGRTFGGAATVFLWGAVILNPDRIGNRVTMVESIAHETAHALLFGLTLGADLTTNDPRERHASPLRPDPRPIEGIVHATYVLARMVYALEQIQQSKRLTETERQLIAMKIERNLQHYSAGLSTVEAHASFTADGAAIFRACRESMEILHPQLA